MIGPLRLLESLALTLLFIIAIPLFGWTIPIIVLLQWIARKWRHSPTIPLWRPAP